MENRPFSDKNEKPDNDSLTKILGKTKSHYDDLVKSTENFNRNWNYSKSSGWIQKVYDSKKALFYLIPSNGCFEISMAIRQKEKDSILNDMSQKKYHELLTEANKYSEGYHIQFITSNLKDYKFSKDFIIQIAAKR